jgi:hypothetical protein
MFESIEKLKKHGFDGFKSIKELSTSNSIIPKEKGVYLILNMNIEAPIFLEVGTGGHFKKKNPNVHTDTLKLNWVENTQVIYIGKAGNLQKRLKQYLDFGRGKPVGHWGGRFIWQISHSNELKICWKVCDKESEIAESQLILAFTNQFGSRPFANLRN